MRASVCLRERKKTSTSQFLQCFLCLLLWECNRFAQRCIAGFLNNRGSETKRMIQLVRTVTKREKKTVRFAKISNPRASRTGAAPLHCAMAEKKVTPSPETFIFGTTMVREVERRHFLCEILMQLKFKRIQSFRMKQDELQSHFVSAC